MFKKSVEAKSQQRLSGTDRKKLKRAIRERFRNASDADVDVLLPPKAEITVTKYPNRVLVYGLEDDCPIFYDIDGRGSEILPTVYALWKVPDLLSTFMLKAGEVSRFILGGADLMFPGIQISTESFPSFSAGEAWAVKVPANPAPIAVGITTMSSTDALKAGLRGKALRISHCYRDTLWESAENPYVPNKGFYEDVVFEDPAIISAVEASDTREDGSSVGQNNGDNNASDAAAEDGSQPSLNSTASTEDPSVNNELGEQITSAMVDLHVTESSSDAKSRADDLHPLSVEDVDALLDKCLLQALRTTVKDNDLPMPGSVLWSVHVLPCRPSGVTLDIKKSSHKKLSKWLQSKSAGGLISVKEDKHRKEMTMFSVNRKHPVYTSFTPEKKKVENNDQKSAKGTADAGRSEKSLEVVEVYKSNSVVNPIFSAVEADTAKLYTASEACEVVFGYIEKAKLVKPTDKSIVVLDAALCDGLFKGAIKKGAMYPTEIHKREVGQVFMNRMQAHHMVSRGSECVVRKGALKPIQIQTERRQGNKKVTRVWGLESFLIDPETMASELQKKFACSTTVSELAGKKGVEVLVQGRVMEDVGRHLVEQYGVHKRYIEVLDKTKK